MSKTNIQFALPVSILREGDSYIAYTPALDLSTVGDSFEEAKLRFEESVGLFFEEISKKGTLEEVLLELGWEKHNAKFTPPVVIAHNTEQFSIPISV